MSPAPLHEGLETRPNALAVVLASGTDAVHDAKAFVHTALAAHNSAVMYHDIENC